jgi:CBS domain-containing protein
MGSRARDIMTAELITVRPEATVEETLRMLVNNRITGLPVVSDGGKMIGVISEYDLLVQIARAKRLEERVFQQKIRFSKKVKAVRDTAELAEIAPMFVKFKYRRLPVVDKKGKLVGIITRRDMMRLFYYRAKLT